MSSKDQNILKTYRQPQTELIFGHELTAEPRTLAVKIDQASGVSFLKQPP